MVKVWFWPTIIGVFFSFLLFGLINSSSRTEEDIIKEFTDECSQKWSSFETRVVNIDQYYGFKLVCQVFHEGQWLPSENVVFDLNKE